MDECSAMLTSKICNLCLGPETQDQVQSKHEHFQDLAWQRLEGSSPSQQLNDELGSFLTDRYALAIDRYDNVLMRPKQHGPGDATLAEGAGNSLTAYVTDHIFPSMRYVLASWMSIRHSLGT